MHLSKRLDNISAQELDSALSMLKSLSSKIRTDSKAQSRKR
jgi:hypothetical protein